jgi:hypothetical protein
MNSRLFVGNDVIINGRLNVYEYTNNNVIYTNVTTSHYTLISAEDMSLNGRLNLNYDTSMNARLFVAGDASMNANLYTFGRTINQGDVSMNTRLFIGGDVSMNSRLFVSNDVSMNGNLYIAKVFKPITISEVFITNTGNTSPYTFDYSTGSIFYITNPPASNFTCVFTNVPTDINRTYVSTLIITATTNKTFCNSVKINNSANAAITPNYANGIPTIFTSGNVITQSISIQRITSGDLTANVIILSAVTAWY